MEKMVLFLFISIYVAAILVLIWKMKKKLSKR